MDGLASPQLDNSSNRFAPRRGRGRLRRAAQRARPPSQRFYRPAVGSDRGWAWRTVKSSAADVRGVPEIAIDLVTRWREASACSQVRDWWQSLTHSIRYDALSRRTRNWRDTPVVPMTVRHSRVWEFSRTASAVSDEGRREARVLAGLRRSSSQLVDLWTREG